MKTKNIIEKTLEKFGVEKELPGRGDLSEKNKLIKLASETASEEKALSEFGDMKYKEALDRFLEANPGKTEKDFQDMVIRIPLNDGGSAKIIKFSDYKDPAEKVKEIDLASLFTPGKTLASLTDSERAQVNLLLKMTLGKKD
jgi:protein involved in sex pheromone biosynthesis|tara:strand:+ start:844 stop:1269 length:426 start_codon:yes stop_codon:yes gene_type:complete